MKRLTLFFIALLFAAMSQAQIVSISASTANAKLEVNEAGKITDGTQGTGKILTSNAPGMASFQPPLSPVTNDTSVSICNQRWMTKNLDVAVYRNGDPIPKVTDKTAWAALTTGAYCYFNNDSATYAATYGKLYNFYAVIDPRGLAPVGCHIPTQNEWLTLFTCLGGDEVAGGTMKEAGRKHWTTPNTGATNLSGFTGLPGGYRNLEGEFQAIGRNGWWWSSTEYFWSTAFWRGLYFENGRVQSGSWNSRSGLSVRCLRN